VSDSGEISSGRRPSYAGPQDANVCSTSSCPTEIPAKLLAGAASLIESVELAWKNMLLSSKKDDALAIFECDGHPWFQAV
jgi:hypothetical protein